MFKLRHVLTILALLALAGCPGSSPDPSGGSDSPGPSGSAQKSSSEQPAPQSHFSLYRVQFADEGSEPESVSREARVEGERLVAAGASPVWIVDGKAGASLVRAAETGAGPEVSAAPLEATDKLLGGEREYHLADSGEQRLELLALAAGEGESSAFYPVLPSAPSGEDGAYRVGKGQVFSETGRIVPSGGERLLGLPAPPEDWGKFHINVDPETREIWGTDERKIIEQRFHLFERAGPRWERSGEFGLTVVQPRTKPPEFTVSPFFLDGDRVIHLRSSPEAPLFDPRYRIFFRDLTSGGERGAWLQDSTRLTWAARAGAGSDYVLAVTPPPRRRPGMPEDKQPEPDSATGLALFNTRTGGRVWSDELPARMTRTGLSRVWRGSDWILLGSWQRKEDSAAGYGKFYLIRTGDGGPEVELVNLASSDLELLPPSNLSLEQIYNGYRVLEGDPANQRTTDDAVYFVQPGEQDARRLLRLSVPDFEVTGKAGLSAGQPVSVRAAEGAVYVLMKETTTPEQEPSDPGPKRPGEKLRESASGS